jgi:hypothetical protein
MRRAAVGVAVPIESDIAVDAAKRTDSDCAEKNLLHGTVPMRPKYLRNENHIVLSSVAYHAWNS